MCGVAGSLSISGGNALSLSEDVRKMIMALRHRGPDDQGIWADSTGRLILGHCRLAIIDLSREGHQPMVSSCGRYVIALNGEIYNFVELRDELKRPEGHFRGHSDTEVFLEAVSQWGLRKALNKAIGMFAFALWDGAEKKIILARDRAGKKPLYYFRDGNSIYFASELKAFKSLDHINLSLNYDSIYQYLTFGYIPAPDTIYENVYEIPAGHYMRIDSNLEGDPESYWEISLSKKEGVTFDEAVEEAESLLQDASRIRLRADVPVGCFLSGGIDSGLLTAIASKQLDKPLKTFTVSFVDDMFDESALANLIAERYSTEHHVIKLYPKLQDILPKVTEAYDEPFADASAIPSYCISKEARKYLKVVLNGEGGDELFGGYRRHLAIKVYSQFKSIFDCVPPELWKVVNRTLPQPKAFRSRYAFLHRFLRGVFENPFSRYIAWCVDGFNEVEKHMIYKISEKRFSSSVKLLAERFSGLGGLHPLDHFMAMDFFFNMHNDMLVKMDIATMAHGLEGRNPFLDQRIIEWATSLPPRVRLKGFVTKPILRKVARKYLPEQIVDAPKKGFEIPLIKWLRLDLAEMVRDVCLSSNGIISELFDRGYVEGLLFGKKNLDPDRWSKWVWTLFMLGMWERANR